MYLHTKLESRTDPIRIAFIGCGKFVSMFLSQYNHLNKIVIDSIVDIDTSKAKKTFKYKPKTNIDQLISIMMENDLNIEKKRRRLIKDRSFQNISKRLSSIAYSLYLNRENVH